MKDTETNRKQKYTKLAVAIVVSGLIGGGLLYSGSTGNDDVKGEKHIEYTMNETVVESVYWIDRI